MYVCMYEMNEKKYLISHFGLFFHAFFVQSTIFWTQQAFPNPTAQKEVPKSHKTGDLSDFNDFRWKVMNERMTKVQHSFPVLRSLGLKIYESYIFKLGWVKLYFVAFNLAGCIKDMMTYSTGLMRWFLRLTNSEQNDISSTLQTRSISGSFVTLHPASISDILVRN